MTCKMNKVAAAVALATIGVSGVAVASGFQLWEQSAAGTGDYHAGGAAEANDASTEFYNPAGMVRIKHPEVSAGLVYIPVDVKFNGTSQITSPLPSPVYHTNGWVKGGTNNLVPNFHFVYPINHRMTFGFGVTVPFGLSTSYPGSDLGAAIGATSTKLMAMNFNPSLAVAISNKLSIGAGVDIVYGRATYNSIAQILGQNYAFNNKLSDTAVGWNAGMLYQYSPQTRFGIAYRSKVTLHATGTSSLGPFSNDNVYADLTLPGTFTMSAFHQLNKQWDVMASAYYTKWNDFTELAIHDSALGPFIGTIIAHENYKNTWNFALGANYHVNTQWTVKLGAGYDMTPTQDGHRDIRLPGNNRLAVAAGFHYNYSKNLGIDFGWTHFFIKEVVVNNTQAGVPAVSIGHAKFGANVVGTQLSWKFA